MNEIASSSFLKRHRTAIWILLLTILLLLLLAMAAAKFGQPDPKIQDSEIGETITTSPTGAGKQ